jgi:dihydrofolate reductase|tara:strand:+ start:183 stop:698 length:516 start_codon:yes stop_codon:yes gene_type:complete
MSANKRRLVLHIATSSDGFIATKDDGLDWLPQLGDSEDYGIADFMQTVECVVIGRRTWDVINQFEEEQFPEFERHILSRSTHQGIMFIKQLKNKSGKDIWLLGGGILNGECLQANIIDEIVITQFPLQLNEGIPVFGPLGVDLPDTWEIENQTGFAKGVTQTKWKPVVNID